MRPATRPGSLHQYAATGAHSPARAASSPASRHASSSGFSLIETLTVLGVICVMVMFAIPDVTRLLADHGCRASARSLAAALELARSEALRRGLLIEVKRLDGCMSANRPSWHCGWDVLIDADNDGRVDTLLSRHRLGPNLTLSYNVSNPVRIDRHGRFVGNVFGTFSLRTGELATWQVVISATGRIRESRG